MSDKLDEIDAFGNKRVNKERVLPCPRLCPGGAMFNEMTGEFDSDCPTCRGYAFVWEDGTVIDSKPERADPKEFTATDWPMAPDDGPPYDEDDEKELDWS